MKADRDGQTRQHRIVIRRRGRENFSRIPNGAPGIETRLVSLFDIGVMQGKLSLNRFVQLTATTPARLRGRVQKVFLRGNLIVDGSQWPGREGMGRFVPRGNLEAF